MSPAIRQALDDVLARLRAQFGARLERAVVFGSHAWGTPDDDSDVDLCVVVEGMSRGERHVVMDIVAEVAIEQEVPLAPLIWSTEELRTRLEHELSLAEDITRRGVDL